MSITGDLLDNSTVVDNVTISKTNNILAVKNYGITQLQVANDAIADRSIVSMAHSKLTSLPARLVDLIALTPALNYTLGTNGTNIILRSPIDQLTATGALPLAGGTMSGAINMGGFNITNIITLQFRNGTRTLSVGFLTGGASYSIYLPANTPALSATTPTSLVLGIGTGNACTWINPETQVYKSLRIGSDYGNATTDYITFGKTAGSPYTLNLPGVAPTINTYLKWDSVTSTFIWASAGSGLTTSGNIAISGNDLSLNAALTGITSVTGLALPTNPTDATSKEYVDSFAYVTPAALDVILAGYLPLIGGLGNMMTGNIVMNSNKVTGLPTPTLSGDAVPKNYVDTALNLYLPLSGSTMTGILTMGNNKITGLPAPTVGSDAVNLSYLEAIIYVVQTTFNSTIAQYLPLVGGALSGNLSMGTHLITNLLAPTSATDAANKAYVDGIASSAASNLAATVANYMPLAGGTHSGPVNMGNNAITNLPNPTNSGDAANKAYVDLLASGFSIKPIVQCLMATTGGYTYSNGILGFGATLTKMNSTSVGLNIDSYILNTGDRVLVNTTATPAYNGVYQLTTNGVNGQNTVLTRASDSDGTPLIELHPGATFFVQNGSIYGGYQYTQTSEIPATVGTDSITYSAITAPSTVTAGSNIIVYQNEVELNPTVTGLNSLQFTSGSGYVNISKAIGGSNYNMILPPSGSAGNQYLVYDNYGVASWTTAPSSGGTYTAGSNLSLNSGVFSVNSALTAINSIQLKEANSSGLVILGKSAGSASYSLNLPGAAPTTNTYLKYDGADYTWSTAGSNTSSLIACQFIHVSSVSPVPTSNNSFLSFNQMVGYSGNAATLTNPTQFTLLPGFTYKCSAMIEIVTSGEIVANWYSVTGSVIFGSAADAGMAGRGNLAVGFITPSVATIISLQVLYSGVNGSSGVEIYNKQPWAIIEVVSSNASISQFTGATALLPGVAGFIPAPAAGTQNSYLRGDGTWQQANNAPTAAQYLFAYISEGGQTTTGSFNTPTPLIFPTANTLTVGSAAIQTDTSTFTILPGYSYKITSAVPLATISSQTLDGVYLRIYMNNIAQGVKGQAVPISSGGAFIFDLSAVCYVTPTVSSTVQVRYAGIAVATIGSVWVTIEAVSNNNTITAFTGATSLAAGSIGYIPAPIAGDQTKFLCGNGTWATVSGSGGGSGSAPAKSWYNEAGGTAPVALVSSSYMTFPLGVGGIGSGSAGSTISKVNGVYVYALAAGNSYKIRFCCDIYSATASTSGSFYIVKSSSSTLPTSPSLSTDTIGSLHATNSTLSSYYKVEVVGYITTSAITYIGIRYGGSAGPAQIANSVLEIDDIWSAVSDSGATAKSWYNEAGGTSPVALVSTSYMTFGLGVGGVGSGSAGSAISKVTGQYVYALAAGNLYKVRFFCDIYSGSTATGIFYIVKSSSSTLPTSPSLSTDTIGNAYQPSSLSAYYKVELVGYITTTTIMYIGIRFGGTANGAQIANSVLEIDLL